MSADCWNDHHIANHHSSLITHQSSVSVRPAPPFVPLVPLALLPLLALVGCADRSPASPYRGIILPAPVAKPAFTLPATDGTSYDFQARTRGKVALLFFGYLNCPDACPVHALNLATVIRELPWEDRQRVTFVFVTTDPERDSLPALRRWLAGFDSSFVGLRGTTDEVNALQRSLNLAEAVRGATRDDSTYIVQHATQIIAFEADDSARVVYPFGTRQEDWAIAIPKLLERQPLERQPLERQPLEHQPLEHQPLEHQPR
jgi:protein SCO1/2